MEGIGFGCARLTANYSEKKALENLETTYDLGITHFDTARLYGFGRAETILGKFAADKRDKITITTKFGLFPGNPLLGNLLIQNVSRSVFRLAKRLPFRKTTQDLANRSISKRFSVKDAEISLETSLRELNTEYVDFLLMHEATVDEANDPDLISFLDRQVESGKIRKYGIGSFAGEISHNFSGLSQKIRVLQTNCSFPDPVPTELLGADAIENRFYFSPLHHFQQVERVLNEDTELLGQVVETLGGTPENAAIDLCLIHQVCNDPNGTVLFASARTERIRKVIERWQDVKGRPVGSFDGFEVIRARIASRLHAAR
jgi:diketogulonate reductase-like aldo/keto reductase